MDNNRESLSKRQKEAKECKDCHFFMPFYMDGEIFRVGSVCTLTEDTKSIEANHDDCPLIEIDDELFKKAESAYVLQQIRSR